MNDDGSQLGETVGEALCGIVVETAAGAMGPEHEGFATGSAALAFGGNDLAIEGDFEWAVDVLVGGVGAIGVAGRSL